MSIIECDLWRYERLGFVEIDRDGDEIIMELQL